MVCICMYVTVCEFVSAINIPLFYSIHCKHFKKKIVHEVQIRYVDLISAISLLKLLKVKGHVWYLNLSENNKHIIPVRV